MLFTKPIDQVTWDDIEEFCNQGIKEGAFLDYKEGFPKNLDKTLAAMANTIGGVVLIGVEETDENKPILPLKGIRFIRGLEEKVINIILSNITPIFLPEVNICKNKNDDIAVVVIRIAQSHQSPHAIESNTKVYIRTGNVNTPESLATIDQLDWLKDHRSKSIILKNNLLEQSLSRYNSLCSRVNEKFSRDGKVFQNKTKGILTLYSSPTYPSSTLQNPSELRKIVEKIKVANCYGTFSFFPYNDIFSDQSNGLLTQDAVIFVRTIDENRLFHTEINSFGLVYYRQALKRVPGGYFQGEWLFCSELIARIDMFIDFLSLYYKEIGYWGFIDLNFTLSQVKDQILWLEWYQSAALDSPHGICPDDKVSYETLITSAHLYEEKDQILFKSVQKLSWAFNIDFSEENLFSYIKKFRK